MLTSVNFVSANKSKARVIVGFKEIPDAAIIKAFGGEIIDQSNELSTYSKQFAITGSGGIEE